MGAADDAARQPAYDAAQGAGPVDEFPREEARGVRQPQSAKEWRRADRKKKKEVDAARQERARAAEQSRVLRRLDGRDARDARARGT